MAELDKYIKMIPGNKSVKVAVDLHRLTKAFQDDESGSLATGETQSADTSTGQAGFKSARTGEHQPPDGGGGGGGGMG